MKNIICLLSIVFTFVCYACYDDEGNYDYHDINEVKITNFPEEMVVNGKITMTIPGLQYCREEKEKKPVTNLGKKGA